MCTEETRQELIFLVAMQASDEALTRVELSDLMETKLAEASWPKYLLRSPNTLDFLIKRGSSYGHIKKVSPFSWSIQPLGLTRISYIIDRFVPLKEREGLEAIARAHA